jgi:hypothetical protein
VRENPFTFRAVLVLGPGVCVLPCRHFKEACMTIRRGATGALLFLFLAAALPAASLGRRLSLDQIVQQGKTVLVGSVVSASTRWGEGKKMIWTDYEVFVEEVWKGSPGMVVTLSFAGGTVDDRSIIVTHVPQLKVGGTYVFSLEDLDQLYASPVIGSEQGLFREVINKETGQRILLDADGWAVGFGSGGELIRLAPAEPADTPDTVILRRDAPQLGASASKNAAQHGIPGATYSDGSGNPLPAPSGLPTLSAAASRGPATGGKPLTREALRAAVRRVLEPREPVVR